MAFLCDLATHHSQEPAPALRDSALRLRDEVRGLVCSAMDCSAYKLEVDVFGSIRNNTHVHGSDADITVIPTTCPYLPSPSKGPDSTIACDLLSLRAFLFEKLREEYGDAVVCHQHKAILICGDEQTNRIRADIVVLLPQSWQVMRGGRTEILEGYEIRSSCEKHRPIPTWPLQHETRASEYDRETKGRYKAVFRALKGILKHGPALFAGDREPPPSFLLENLFACVSPAFYIDGSDCLYRRLKRVLHTLYLDFQSGRARDFCELGAVQNLFHPVQNWSFDQVHMDIAHLCRSID